MPDAFELPPDLLEAVIGVESNWNEKAVNKKSKATGLGQITPIALKDFNIENKTKYIMKDMLDPQKNMRVSYWYLNDRIPQLLGRAKIPVTTENVLAGYNAGVGRLKEKKADLTKMPIETQNYLKKVKNLLGRTQ